MSRSCKVYPTTRKMLMIRKKVRYLILWTRHFLHRLFKKNPKMVRGSKMTLFVDGTPVAYARDVSYVLNNEPAKVLGKFEIVRGKKV